MARMRSHLMLPAQILTREFSDFSLELAPLVVGLFAVQDVAVSPQLSALLLQSLARKG